uniref:Gamma tubulin complex component C-terminal domain-containing protein n=2 Tax=Graphocephala atropunctata TaxID=36148 RepID=A0A1B6KIX4_9HEMI
MKDCMFMNHDLIAIINKILASCIEFCDFMQRMQRYFLDAELTSMLSDDRLFDSDVQSMDGVDSKSSENQSFEDNIKRLDAKFTSYLITLLTTISNLGQEETVEKLRNILYRENFNGFYTEKMERGSDSVTSTSTSG